MSYSGRSGPSRHPGGYWRRLKCPRQPVAGWRDANFLAVALIHRAGKAFMSSADSIFVSRFRQQIFIISRFVFCQQIPSADFCCQQFFFLSANSVSRFLKQAISFLSTDSVNRFLLSDVS